jgi:hypothetical protein
LSGKDVVDMTVGFNVEMTGSGIRDLRIPALDIAVGVDVPVEKCGKGCTFAINTDVVTTTGYPVATTCVITPHSTALGLVA